MLTLDFVPDVPALIGHEDWTFIADVPTAGALPEGVEVSS
jgi:hypothetical protein